LVYIPFHVTGYFPANSRRGFPIKKLNIHSVVFKAGRAGTADEPIQVGVINAGKPFQYLFWRVLPACFNMVIMCPGNARREAVTGYVGGKWVLEGYSLFTFTK
jgi:hypothetical protein